MIEPLLFVVKYPSFVCFDLNKKCYLVAQKNKGNFIKKERIIVDSYVDIEFVKT